MGRPVVLAEIQVGIVKAERLIQVVQEDITKDIQKMFDAAGDEPALIRPKAQA